MRLTDISVRNLRTPESGQVTYHDDTITGFGVRVSQGGTKTFILIYGRRRQRKTLGRVGLIALADARQEAKRILAEHTLRRTNAKMIRFGTALDEYLADLKARVEKGANKPRTLKDYTRLLNKHFLPDLKEDWMGDITYEDVIDCTDDVSEGEANHALSVARIFFRWCLRPPRRYVASNPLEGIQIAASNRRTRVLSDEELKAVWDAGATLGYPFGTVVQLFILLGQRRTETASLCAPWVNERDRLIKLPSWLTKNSEEHTLPYGNFTAAILNAVPRRNSTDLLFACRISEDRPITGWSKWKNELDTLSGVDDYTLHDLRRTYRTIHARVGTPPHIGERLVNHISGQTDMERVYDHHKYIAEMRACQERYEAEIQRIVDNASPP